MSTLFLVLIGISFVLTLLHDSRRWKDMDKAGRWIYGILSALSGGMTMLLFLNIRVPLPTQFVTHTIAPFVYRMLKDM